MAGNIIVTTTVNKVTWQVDKSAYGRALKQVKSLKKEWEGVNKAMAKKANPAQKLISASAQAKLVSKRLAQTQRAEAAKTTAHAIAMAKKEAAARRVIDRVENQRRKDAVSRIYSRRTPESKAEYGNLRDHFKQLQRQLGPEVHRPPRTISSAKPLPGGYKPSGINSFGPRTPPDPKVVARQIAEMNRYAEQKRKADEREAARSSKDAERRKRALDKETADTAKALKRREIVVANAQRRLEGALGANWRKKSRGFDTLAETFKLRSGNIAEFNSQIGQMIRQARAGQQATTSLSQGMNSLRSSVISATAAYTGFSAGNSVLKNGQFFESTRATMLMVSESTEEAGKKMKFVQSEAYRLGLDLKVASKGYAQMAVNSKGVISDGDNDKLFTSLSEFATASGADPVRFQRGITAIGQMLGKGQIMAEELKGQLAEALPGALQAFVKAAQTHFKDDKIGVPELMNLMQKGELLAKDILPHVADELAKTARKNGALSAQMKSNRVAMERLTQTWQVWQAEIFDGGFGDAMTNLFNTFSKILHGSTGSSSAIGKFAQGFINNLTEIVAVTHDVFFLIGLIIDEGLASLGLKKKEIDKFWDVSGSIASWLVLFLVVRRLFTVLTKIAGLKGSLKWLFGAAATAGAAGAAGGAAGGNGNPRKPGGLFGLAINPYAIAGLYGLDYTLSSDAEKNEKQRDLGNAYSSGAGDLMAVSSAMLGQWWNGLMGSKDQARENYLSRTGLGRPSPANGTPYPIAPQQVEVKVTTTVNDSAVNDLIDQKLEAYATENINLLTGVPSF